MILLYSYNAHQSRAQPSMPPGRGRLVVWLEFIVTNTFLIQNVRWTIKSQSMQLKSLRHWSTEWLPRFYSEVGNFCKRELCASVLSSSKDWATTNLLMNKLRRFLSLCEGRISPAVLAQDQWLKSESLQNYAHSTGLHIILGTMPT